MRWKNFLMASSVVAAMVVPAVAQADVALAVSSSVSKANGTRGWDLVRWKETGLAPNERVSYEITGNDGCGNPLAPVSFSLTATNNGVLGNSVYVPNGACPGFKGMKFSDLTTPIEVGF